MTELWNEVRATQNSQPQQIQSMSNLVRVMGQLASSIQNIAVGIEKEKLPSQLILNPKGV